MLSLDIRFSIRVALCCTSITALSRLQILYLSCKFTENCSNSSFYFQNQNLTPWYSRESSVKSLFLEPSVIEKLWNSARKCIEQAL